MTESFTVDSLNNVTMNLRIYPNGDDAENEGYVSVFLANESIVDIQIDFFSWIFSGKFQGVSAEQYFATQVEKVIESSFKYFLSQK